MAEKKDDGEQKTRQGAQLSYERKRALIRECAACRVQAVR